MWVNTHSRGAPASPTICGTSLNTYPLAKGKKSVGRGGSNKTTLRCPIILSFSVYPLPMKEHGVEKRGAIVLLFLQVLPNQGP